MQTKIYFVRHGKVYNPTDILYGRLPRFGLGEEGQQQIVQTAAFLESQKIDHLYSSPILRAKQTAKIIQKNLGLPKIVFSKYLLETLTSLQGKSSAYLRTINFDIYAGPKKDTQGETLDDVYKRVENFLTRMVTQHAGKNVVAVTHGDVLMLLKAKFAALPIIIESIRPGEEKYVYQGEVYQVTFEDSKPISLKSVFKPTI
jgi:broad specificity phosphatase PhoE